MASSTKGHGLTVPLKFALGAAVMAVVGNVAWNKLAPEPITCGIIRNFLESSERATEWQLEQDPSQVADFPIVPLSMVKECGAPSFNMPYPYQFQFLAEEELPSSEYIFEQFAERNKTVYSRPIPANESPCSPFSRSNSLAPASPSPFPEAWACVSRGECSLYFDNTWELADYGTILSKKTIDLLTQGVNFGSMFISNYEETKRTASFHAAPFKSLATQFINEKTWDFISPKNVKKYLTPIMPAQSLIVDQIAQNHTRLLEMIPHYQTTTKPGWALYFPEYWTHSVTTVGGVNLMTNWRQEANLIDQWKSSPHSLRNKVKQFVGFFSLKYILPESFVNELMAKGRDILDQEQETASLIKLYEANQNSAF